VIRLVPRTDERLACIEVKTVADPDKGKVEVRNWSAFLPKIQMLVPMDD
jgi:hypothetical protein